MKKLNRRKTITRSSRRPWVLVGLLVVIGAVVMTPDTPEPKSVAEILATPSIPSLAVMDQQEAYQYHTQVIVPILRRYATDRSEIPAIRTRLQRLFDLSSNGLAGFAYHNKSFQIENRPPNPNVLVAWQLNEQAKTPVLHTFIPRIKEYGELKPRGEFEDYIAAMFSHEMVHYELSESGEFPFSMSTKNSQGIRASEAVAWGITIIEVINPMIESGRMKDPLVLEKVRTFTKFGSNPRNPSWIDAFSNYLSQG